MKCASNKKVFQTAQMAEDALIEAHKQFEYSSGNGPVAVYRCEDCGYYHLTSKGPMNERLSNLLKDGKVNRDREANQWLDRIKRKNS